jgi:predicted transcriptional regulator
MSPIHLSQQQLDVMDVLWSRGAATASDVHAALEPALGLAPTTVATVLQRLAKRGVLTAERQGRAYVYAPAVSRERVRRSMTGRLMDQLFGGRPAALVSHLLREEELGADDLAELQQLLRQARAAEGDAPESDHPDADRHVR